MEREHLCSYELGSGVGSKEADTCSRTSFNRRLIRAGREELQQATRYAIHEAGHACAAVLMGGRIRTVRLDMRSTGDGADYIAGGYCEISAPKPILEFFFGGTAAERLFGYPRASTTLSSTDLSGAVGASKALGVPFLLEPQTRAVEMLLAPHFQAVKRLALALLTEGQIGGERAESTLGIPEMENTDTLRGFAAVMAKIDAEARASAIRLRALTDPEAAARNQRALDYMIRSFKHSRRHQNWS